jgi:uncharacterized membrane protein
MRWRNIAKNHFFSGVLVVAPITVVLTVFQWLFGGLIDWIETSAILAWFASPTDPLWPMLRYLILLLLFAAVFVSVSIIGFFSKLYFGKQLLRWVSRLIQKIPVFGAIYSSLDQLFMALSPSTDGTPQFNRVVLLEYPRQGVWAVGFVTGVSAIKALPKGMLNVFVPTVPNPTSGFHLLVPEKDVLESGMRVDEAFRLILSLGLAK